MIRVKPTEIVDMDDSTVEVLLRRLARQALQPEDFSTLAETLKSYHYVTRLIEKQSTTIGRLRAMLFGATTETTSSVTGRDQDCASPEVASEKPADSVPQNIAVADSPVESTPTRPGKIPGKKNREKVKAKGHGRNGADAFPTAQRRFVEYGGLKSGNACPKCVSGTAYRIGTPKTLIRFIGQAPIQPLVYELESFRCDLCGETFTAPPPEGVGDEKYDATVVSVLGLLKYGCGMPFNRLKTLEKDMGIPLAASTQWEIVLEGARDLEPVHEELIRQAAQGQVVHNDDTTVKILDLAKQRAASKAKASNATPTESARRDDGDNRTGMFTTGIVSILGNQRSVALYFSGGDHAGENLLKVLAKRVENLPPPIQMCDALSRNCVGEFQTILANCLAHARRKFVDVYEHFEEECRHVLEELEKVYANDALAKERQLSPQERLEFHKTESGPIMDRLQEWMKDNIELKVIESNSGVGAAIGYMRKHWSKLTLFLRVAGAPLDNNICERALKKAIVNRKNSLFYKTNLGARVGDLYMALIFTCDLNDANPFDYLTRLLRHKDQIAVHPDRWLPWNYRENFNEPRAGPVLEQSVLQLT